MAIVINMIATPQMQIVSLRTDCLLFWSIEFCPPPKHITQHSDISWGRCGLRRRPRRPIST